MFNVTDKLLMIDSATTCAPQVSVNEYYYERSQLKQRFDE